MRLLRLLVALVALPLVLTPGARADHHLIKVTEVFPAADAGAQFVELKDDFMEPFPHANYTIAALDGSGAPLSSQVIDPPYGFKNSTQPFLIRDGGDLELTMTVAPPAVRVCFYRNTMAEPSALVNCLAYDGLSIPAGQSAQRQPCGSVAAAAPTPDGPNADTGACSGGGPGGTGPGGPGGGTGGADTRAPRASVSARRRQDVDRLALAVRSDEAAVLTASATVNVPGAARNLRFRTVTRSVRAGARARLRLRLSRRNLRAAKRALRRGRRLTAKVRLRARDQARNTSTTRRNIRLTD